MKSKNTFSEEYESLIRVPGVFYPSSEGDSAADGVAPLPIEDPFEDPERYPILETSILPPEYSVELPVKSDNQVNWIDLSVAVAPAPMDVAEAARPTTFDAWLEDKLGLDIGAVTAGILNNASERARIAAATADLGTEAFGLYLPWHQHVNSKQTPWGMYFQLRNLLAWAGTLVEAAERIGESLPPRQAIRLAFFATYRHELFHFHVERFATRQEVLQRRAIYRPYDLDVFRTVAGTSGWLEEALAQAVVLESTLLADRTGMKKQRAKKILTGEFLRIGPGYRDFGCEDFGGPDKAHRLLAAQVVTGEINPSFSGTSISTPRVEYGADHRLVPGFIVWDANFFSRFQFATPEYWRVKTWMKHKGFSFVGPGPGDHENWRFDQTSEIVQVNCRGKEVDLASMKNLARVVGRPLRVVREEIRSA